ncbi:deoxyribonuclease V [filamentous cyanobacterium LEGE 11480]|uniref:Endonuclease V n=1 Tax=Romeriopsis navalis LEGE 11480 TaxID=2777977 RepID=A0A928VIU0_9CYAN|nr:deoxyribonuclease V [Romeriopsis navalis]MBE9028467.1 deoxyribonuclease V [Romeriopsis navalis LEGE 11480]
MLRPVLEYRHPENAKAAIALQEELRQQISLQDDFGDVQLVAGVDVGFEDQGATVRAAVVVLQLPGLAVVESAIARRPTAFPYIPGLLSFREIPVLLDVLAKLKTTPDLILCDGNGYIHPRRFGLACHLGLLLDHPTIGVAKSRFLGEHPALGEVAGDWQPITHQGETIGAIVRNRTNVRPIYVSSGHRVGLASAIKFVRQCSTKYRLPETTRLADRLSKQDGVL